MNSKTFSKSYCLLFWGEGGPKDIAKETQRKVWQQTELNMLSPVINFNN